MLNPGAAPRAFRRHICGAFVILAGVFEPAIVLADGPAPPTIGWTDLKAPETPVCRARRERLAKKRDCAPEPVRVEDWACDNDTVLPRAAAVRIAGYVHPLEYEFRGVSRFLLSPPLSNACKHPPPPPPNQLIYVEFPPGIDISFDPIFVTGRLTAERFRDGAFATAYRLKATKVEPATIPDVRR